MASLSSGIGQRDSPVEVLCLSMPMRPRLWKLLARSSRALVRLWRHVITGNLTNTQFTGLPSI